MYWGLFYRLSSFSVFMLPMPLLLNYKYKVVVVFRLKGWSERERKTDVYLAWGMSSNVLTSFLFLKYS